MSQASVDQRNWNQPNNVFGRQSNFDYSQSQRYDAFSRADETYQKSSSGANMGNHFYESELDRFADMRESNKVTKRFFNE
jgi:hypothetical protein